MIMNWLSWGTLIKVLPWAIGFGGVKTAMHYLGLEPWMFDSLTGSLLGAATFALTIVLSGTLSDYRSSESMPSQIVNSLATIQDNSAIVGQIEPTYDSRILEAPIVQVAQSITAWLQQGQPFEQVESSIADLNSSLVALGSLDKGLLVIHRMQTEIAQIRALVYQMKGVRDSDFVPEAYTLLFLFMSASSMTLLLIHADSFSESIVTSTFLFTLLAYLLLFIRDLDNPFQYDGKSAVDVDLSCLQQFCDRMTPPHSPATPAQGNPIGGTTATAIAS
jgi:hypothetical protein